MIDALSAAAGSMMDDVSRLNTISRNLANALTPAYKRDVAVGRPFALAIEAAHAGQPATAVDHRGGTLRYTGRALDVALDGDGWFEVSTPWGMRYTRRGDFQLDAAGQLVTHAGHPVQVIGAAVQVPANPTIDRDGRVLDGERVLTQLRIVAFAPGAVLERSEDGLFRSSGSGEALADGSTRVRQAHLEASNVDNASEMVKLVETLRHFEAVQKIVQGVDEMTERTLRKLGEF